MQNENWVILKDNRKLGYSEYGDQKGKLLFYFHGWPTSRLQAQINETVAKKLHIRIISIDRPGYGLSDFKKDRKLVDWPSDVVELADQLTINKFAVMGVSGGGPYAAVCASKIPNRLTKVGIVVGLAPTYIPGILNGMSRTAKLGWANYAKFPLLRTFSSLLHYLNAKYAPLGLHRFMYGAKADKKIFSDKNIRESTRRNYKEAFREGYKGVELDLKLYTENWGFDLGDIKAKVLLFYGEDDKNVSIAMGKYYAAQIPHSKLIVYPGEGHLVSRTHAEEILKALTD
jgi:pimeloyl-ACP methyl ester carboxylesterase